VTISRAGPDDIRGLAELLWLHDRDTTPDQPSLDDFAAELADWWDTHQQSHTAFVARAETQIVGMAWVALVPRAPRPGAITRLTGDIQSVFVRTDHRGRGIGSALVEAAAEHATGLGALRVTVHSGRKAVPVYERLGFVWSPRLLQRPPD
jgi:GNAT superfamily N-acetyltransferase